MPPLALLMHEKLNERPSRWRRRYGSLCPGEISLLMTRVSRESPHPVWSNLASLGHLHHTQLIKYANISPLPTSTTPGNWWFLLWRNLNTYQREKTQLSILGISNVTRSLLYFYMWEGNEEWPNIWEMSLSEPGRGQTFVGNRSKRGRRIIFKKFLNWGAWVA